MNKGKLSLFGIFTLITIHALLFTACNENANTKTTIVTDSTKVKKTKKVIDTTAEPRPLLPGG